MTEFSPNSDVRQPAVAGLFYPKDADELRATIDRLLANSSVSLEEPILPKALIVPHAGYPYSGSVAAAAYRLIEPLKKRVKRVVLIGPSHRVYVQGIALPRTRIFATPLGDISIDDAGCRRLLRRGDVLASDAPHEFEHCLEVQLPFLQTVLDDFTLLPLVVGSTTAAHVAEVLDDVWDDAGTLILASSDLSHYLTYDAAREIDAATANDIINCKTEITHEQACGAAAINGLLSSTRRRGLEVIEIARQNSGDTSGNVSRVVGYGAFVIHESRHRRTQ